MGRESINFELDVDQLKQVVPEDVINHTTFLWKFGDGAKGTGLKNSHTYTKMGSHTLTIDADTSSFEKGTAPVLLQSIRLQVLPDRSYQLPQTTIHINGQEAYRDPTTKTLENVFSINLQQPVLLDAVLANKPSVKIVSYLWDLGDESVGHEQRMSHEYKNAPDVVFPALRVKDENGFIVDTSVGLKHDLTATPRTSQAVGNTPGTKKTTSYLLLLGVISSVVVAALGSFGIRYYRHRE